MCEMRVHSLINSECIPWAVTVLSAGAREHRRQQSFHRWKWKSCPTLCDPMDYRVHGSLQARVLQWVAFPFSRGSSQPRDWTQVSRIAGGFFTAEPQGKPLYHWGRWQMNKLETSLRYFRWRLRRVNLGEGWWRDRWMFFRRRVKEGLRSGALNRDQMEQ